MASVLECGICYFSDPPTAGDFFVTTPCGHIFHNSCIREWINRPNGPVGQGIGCPMDRLEITEDKLVRLNNIFFTQAGGAVIRAPMRLKILMIGDTHTGKTSLVRRYCDGQYDPNYRETVGIDSSTKDVQISGRTIKLTIWDCAGQDRFKAITPNYFRRADGIFAVYDITKSDSFRSVTSWLELAEDWAPPGIPAIMVGNKSDETEKREVSLDAGIAQAQKLQTCFLETSAKDAENVEAAFRLLATAAHDNFLANKQADDVNTSIARSTIVLHETPVNENCWTRFINFFKNLC